MTAFPSGSVPTDNLNQSTDKPKDARADLLTMAQKVNDIVSSFNANNGICGLTASGKVDSAKLIGQVQNASLNGAVIKTANIADANTSDQGVTGAKIRDNTIPTSKLSQVSTDTAMGGGSPSNSLIPTQSAVSGFASTLVGASDIKYLLKAQEVAFFDINWSNADVATVPIRKFYSSHTNYGAYALVAESGQPISGGNFGIGTIGESQDVQGSNNETAFDVLHNTYPVAGGTNKNFTFNPTTDTITIENDGTYVLEFGYQGIYTGDDGGDDVGTTEGWDFYIRDGAGNSLHKHEIRGGGGDNQNWVGRPNFRTTLAFSGTGTSANQIKFEIDMIGGPDNWNANTGFYPYYCMLYQTTLTTAMTSKWL
tara:strand:- start:2740 stop:3840 length:1101 start_codon:yes stop_codon:yes gene_type:complete